MQNRVRDGRCIDITAENDIRGGDVVALSGCIAIASADIPQGETGACEVYGVYELAKVSGAVSQGAKVYLDGDGNITTAATTPGEGEGAEDTANTYAGVAWAAAASGDATVLVSINF